MIYLGDEIAYSTTFNSYIARVTSTTAVFPIYIIGQTIQTLCIDDNGDSHILLTIPRNPTTADIYIHDSSITLPISSTQPIIIYI
jgi:hypothetical protein